MKTQTYTTMRLLLVMFIILGVFPCLITARNPQHQQQHESHHRHNHHSHHQHHRNRMHNQQKQSIDNSNIHQNSNIGTNRNTSTSSTVLDRRRSAAISSRTSSETAGEIGSLNEYRNSNYTREFSYNNGYNPSYQHRSFNGWSVSTNRLGGNGDRGADGYLPKDVEEIDEETLRRRMYEVSSTTQAPTVVVRTGKGNKNFNKNMDRRNVCVQHKTVQIPVKTTEVYSRPTWRHVSEPCQGNQVCTRVEMVHEPAYRDVIRHKTTKQTVYTCCPGWEKVSKTAEGCMKPVCKFKCRNGGTCSKPDTCSCPAGFTGKLCEKDINECKEDKPCDQLCFNTEGSYFCQCRDGFYLHSDKQSCKKSGGDNNAFEARDLENEVDQEDVTARLRDIEYRMQLDRITTNELQKKLQSSSNVIDNLKLRINTLETRQLEYSDVQQKLRKLEENSRRYDHLLEIFFKCRTNPNNPACPK